MNLKTRIIRILILLGLIAIIAGAWLVVKMYEAQSKVVAMPTHRHLA